MSQYWLLRETAALHFWNHLTTSKCDFQLHYIDATTMTHCTCTRLQILKPKNFLNLPILYQTEPGISRFTTFSNHFIHHCIQKRMKWKIMVRWMKSLQFRKSDVITEFVQSKICTRAPSVGVYWDAKETDWTLPNINNCPLKCAMYSDFVVRIVCNPPIKESHFYIFSEAYFMFTYCWPYMEIVNQPHPFDVIWYSPND